MRKEILTVFQIKKRIKGIYTSKYKSENIKENRKDNNFITDRIRIKQYEN